MIEDTASSGAESNSSKRSSVQISLSDRYQPLSARQGGMGVVIFCEDKEDNLPVALKTSKPELLSKRAARSRFVEETANWIYLGSHPNIVQAYRVEQMGNPSQPFVVMEHIKSANEHGPVALSEHLRHAEGTPFTPERALQIALDICMGMRYAAERIDGLVHRDLKPGNILIGRDGIAQICDFGLLSTLTEEAIKQRKVLLSQVEDEDYIPAGSTAYIAPEAWQRMNIADCRADIYAVGLMLIEMLTAKQAVDPRDKNRAKQAHCNGNLPELGSSVPTALRELVKKCTALDKNNRFPDWAGFERAIIKVYQQIFDHPPRISAAGDAPSDRLSNANSYAAIGISFLDLGYTEVASPYLTRALEIAQDLDDAELQLKARLALARVLTHEEKTEQAIEMLKPGLTIIEDDENIEGCHDMQALLGNLYAKIGEYDQALTVLNKALTQVRSAADENAEILLLGSLGNTCAENKRYAKAIFYYRAQLPLLKRCNDQINMSTCLANLGAAYLDVAQPGNALPYLHQAAELCEASGNINGHPQAVRLLCEAYIKLEDKPSLCKYAQSYLQLCLKFNDRDEIAWVQDIIQLWACDTPNSGHVIR